MGNYMCVSGGGETHLFLGLSTPVWEIPGYLGKVERGEGGVWGGVERVDQEDFETRWITDLTRQGSSNVLILRAGPQTTCFLTLLSIRETV